MTDNDNPTPQELVARLLDLLDVKDQGGDRFEGARKIGGIGRVFGGQVIGQALASAERTVPDDRPVHSLHAYFLRGGSEDHEIDFKVERDLDGGSFSNRRVVASQLGKTIFNMIASFQRVEPGAEHTTTMPDVPAPETLTSTWSRRHHTMRDGRVVQLGPRPIELRAVDPDRWSSDKVREPVSHIWFRSVAPLPDSAKLHRAVLAYASDMALLGTSVLPHPDLRIGDGSIVSASLDHAIWFHDDFRADEWMLYACDSPWAGRARGFNRGRIYTRDGRLVASVAQEGLIRPVAPFPARD
ncbi:acyl-CoA thioesterase [Novosphingobium taihuense]|uniref:Acyl-CoA thioesterase 2 n=1 Tax=Novosphingobium taihuense TaxID=260085 RepID=A0A7W7AEA7_9SPHN|nr:acyl-CoA thioesterase II [Novosphingobium taihuense]MBB4615321.1 acyl-CoA thioesterase-2 [Novosphingobium taihuense]TWH84356.1 acyl-CoA thioesterase-2 [Novosphingobium taihuense]